MRSAFLRRILLLALFCAPGTLVAQGTGTLTGTVVDSETGLALAGATVSIEGTNRASLTNQEGRFVLLGLPAGTHTARVVYLGYASSSETVTITAGGVTTVRFMMSTDAVDVEGMTVVGQRRGQAAALNQQLTAPNVTNVVAADQIGRFPDANIGDALKRIPGISVIWDQGEARFGLVRGTEPRLNSVTINGERVPSAEAEVREVQLDLVPSDMVSAVEVNKTLTPDMDADAIGGSINIVTRAAPSERRISGTLGSGVNFLTGKPMQIGSAVLADRFGADDRFGLVVSGSWFDHQLGSDNIEAEWDEGDNGAFVDEFQVRQYDVQRIRRSISASLDFRLSESSTITLRSIYNHRDDWENRYRQVYALGEPDAAGNVVAEVERQTKAGLNTDRLKNARLEDQRTQSWQLAGDHLFGGIELNWSAQWAQASEERLNERYINFVAEDVPMSVDVSDARRPALTFTGGTPTLDAFGLDELTEESQYTEDQDLNGRLDLTIPLSSGATQLKVGGRYREKDKLRDNNFFEYSPTSGGDLLGDYTTANLDDPDFLPGGQYGVGTVVTNKGLGNLPLESSAYDNESKPDEFQGENFDATERIIGGYAMISQQLGSSTSLLAGVRVESTDVDYNGFEFIEDDETSRPTVGSQSYTDIFPNLQIRHEVDPSTVLRAAFTSTLARPNYFDLVPYRIINQEDNELALGNPSLQPTTSLNFDLMAEKYFQSVGILSGGVFYKDISDFIFEYTQQDATDPVTNQVFDELSRPENGAGATLFGFEVALQRQLDFLGGFARNLGIYANYTFTESSIDGLPIEGREDEDLPLPGTSKHTLNASLSYDTRTVQVRGALNLQDDFIDPGELGDSPFFDRYYDRQVTIDANASVQLSPTVRFFVEANNLTNQPLRYYQGTVNRLMQEEFYDRRVQTGLKIDLR